MKLIDLLDLIPSTTPIRIYNEGNPYGPLIELAYSDSLIKSGKSILLDTVNSVHSSVHGSLPCIVISISMVN